jgi:hypothetical protein
LGANPTETGFAKYNLFGGAAGQGIFKANGYAVQIRSERSNPLNLPAHELAEIDAIGGQLLSKMRRDRAEELGSDRGRDPPGDSQKIIYGVFASGNCG